MSGFVSKKDLMDENRDLKNKISETECELPGSDDDVLDQMSYRVINNPHKENKKLRFLCNCCVEVEMDTLIYTAPLCAHCNRPMTRLRTWVD